MTDGTRRGSRPPSLSPALGEPPAAEANTSPLCLFDHRAVLRDRRTRLFIIYVFSHCKRLTVPY